MKCNPPYPKTFSHEVKDFVQRLLTKDPSKRLGSNGAEEVKLHPFFKVRFYRMGVSDETRLHLKHKIY